MQTEATGERDHELLEEIEVIFGNFKYMNSGALTKCRNLQKFTMMNCDLKKISSFEPVSASLVHLCLSNQNISNISGLSSLHELRHLYLQQNNISRIEGLERCRKLKTLWLFDNCLTTVDNLGFCTNLRELWLQNNKIQTLKASSDGISNLVNLQRLNLANNRIRDVDEFEHLRKLIVLRQLSFSDEHFGSNPIVHHPDYRSSAITILKQLRQLDGTLIRSEERSTAVDQFLTQALEFNDQLAELTLAYQQELRLITTRKERGKSNAQMLQQELMEALNDVETCVTAGQAQIEEEKQRQLQLREQNADLLRENVAKIQHDFCTAINEQYDLEDKALLEEERDYEIMELEAMAEQRLALTIAAVQHEYPHKVAFQQLLEHMPDYRFIAANFRRPTNQQHDVAFGADESTVHILQMYRCFHDDRTAAYERNTKRMEKEKSSGGSELYLYLVANDDELTLLLQNGLGHIENSEWVFLFSNPLVALEFYIDKLEPLETDESLAQSSSEVDSDCTTLVENFNLLLCQVRMQQTIELFHPQRLPLTSLEALHALASPRGSALPPPPTAFLQFELGERHSWSTSSSGGHVYMARRAHVHSQILPQFVLLCSKHRELSTRTHASSRRVGGETPSSELLLTQFQQQLRAEIDAYHTRLYVEMDPATARLEAQFQHDNEQLRQRLKENEDRINQEKMEQDRILRSLRGGGNEKTDRRRKANLSCPVLI